MADAQEPDRKEDALPEEREDAQLVLRSEAVREAKSLLRRRREAVLCTASRRFDGWPFGSIAPYALGQRGETILLISTIAQHTINLATDDRLSVFVYEGSEGDVQSQGRLTLMGRARAVADGNLLDARARYLARFPDASGYFQTHDFGFYQVDVEHVRYIGGFGKIFWLDAKELIVDPEGDPLHAAAPGIIRHMNTDHADAMVLYCRAFKQMNPSKVEMIGIDEWGFDLQIDSPSARLRFDFDTPATPENVRPIVVQMVRRAREILGEAS